MMENRQPSYRENCLYFVEDSCYFLHGLNCMTPYKFITNSTVYPMTQVMVFRIFFLFGRYFHSPTDTKEVLYDPASVMNGDTLKFCQKEAWCKMSFFVLSFFYYLYWCVLLFILCLLRPMFCLPKICYYNKKLWALSSHVAWNSFLNS